MPNCNCGADCGRSGEREMETGPVIDVGRNLWREMVEKARLWEEVRPLIANWAGLKVLPGRNGQALADWIDAHKSELEAE